MHITKHPLVTKHLTRSFLAVVALTLWTAGCGDESASSARDAAPNSAQLTLAVAPHPENTLMALAELVSDSAGRAAITFTSEGVEERSSRWVPISANTPVEIVAIGMRAETQYTIEALIELADGSVIKSAPLAHTTGALPASAPTVTLSDVSGDMAGGITIFAHGSGRRTDSTAPLYFGVDEDGEIVWYLHGTDIQGSDGVVRGLENGNLLMFLTDSLAEITPAGEVVTTYEVGEKTFHHDAVVLPNGNLLFLSAETAAIDNPESPHDGEMVTYDVLYEIDPASGAVEWAWSTLDHLDTARFPSALSERNSSQGGLDWTHANALHYLPASDTVLLSSRSQSWVIHIDRSSNDILWVFGEPDGVVDSNFAPNFFSLNSGTFQTAQHAPMLASNGDLLLFDNRNDSGGTTENSRAVRYSLNEDDFTASQVWEFVAPKYAPRLGDVDELANGNVLMCAGGGDDETAYLSEVAPDGRLVWQLVVDDEVYRAERIAWDAFR